MKIFGLVFGIPAQKAIIDKHCFGTCKKIIMGAIDAEGIGPMMVCRTEDCPHEAANDGPFGEVQGDEVWVRKLKESLSEE